MNVILGFLFLLLTITVVIYLVCAARIKDPSEDDEQAAYLQEWYEKHKKEI